MDPPIEGEYGPNGVNLGEVVASEGEDCAGEYGRGVDWVGERALAVDKVGRCKGSRGRLWGLVVGLAVVLELVSLLSVSSGLGVADVGKEVESALEDGPTVVLPWVKRVPSSFFISELLCSPVLAPALTPVLATVRERPTLPDLSG